jgi:hypothetical protein
MPEPVNLELRGERMQRALAELRGVIPLAE